MEVYKDTDVDETLKMTAEQLINRIETYEMNGSGWIVSRLMALGTTAWLLDALCGSTFHQLPEWMRSKRAVRNIQNKDNRCFKWTVLAGLYESKQWNEQGVIVFYMTSSIMASRWDGALGGGRT